MSAPTPLRPGEWYRADDGKFYRWPDPTPHSELPRGGDLPAASSTRRRPARTLGLWITGLAVIVAAGAGGTALVVALRHPGKASPAPSPTSVTATPRQFASAIATVDAELARGREALRRCTSDPFCWPTFTPPKSPSQWDDKASVLTARLSNLGSPPPEVADLVSATLAALGHLQDEAVALNDCYANGARRGTRSCLPQASEVVDALDGVAATLVAWRPYGV